MADSHRRLLHEQTDTGFILSATRAGSGVPGADQRLASLAPTGEPAEEWSHSAAHYRTPVEYELSFTNDTITAVS